MNLLLRHGTPGSNAPQPLDVLANGVFLPQEEDGRGEKTPIELFIAAAGNLDAGDLVLVTGA